MEGSRMPNDWLRLTTSKTFDPGVNLDERCNKMSIVPALNENNGILISSLVEQLCRLFDRDPKEQQRIYFAICNKLRDLRLIDESYKINEFAGLRSHYRQAVVKCMNTRTITNPLLETSRYHNEYEELQWLSSGGFGQVFRARHRLDQVEYAVKKIRAKYKDTASLLRALTEVKTLARLNHRNVVQYKSAWLEAAQYSVPIPPRHENVTEESDIVVFEGTGDEASSEDSDEKERNMALCAYRGNLQASPISKMGTTLYVSMQLCDQNLREWLDDRNSNPSVINHSLVLDIIRQTTMGLEFIHSKNIIHHDIKPSNIFISRDSLVQVGDFGLACDARDGGSCPVRFGQRGTSLYAAPEQQRGQCHQCSDIFSLGLVLLELVNPFATDMERIAVLTDARKGILPPGLMPPVQGLLKDLLAWRIEKRITAINLLKRIEQFDGSAVDDKDAIIAELRRQLAQKDKQVRRLQRRIRSSHGNENP